MAPAETMVNSSVCVINGVSPFQETNSGNKSFAELVERGWFSIALRGKKTKNLCSCLFFWGSINKKCWVIEQEIWYVCFFHEQNYSQIHQEDRSTKSSLVKLFVEERDKFSV